jgi:hypothetical protein
MNVLPNEHVVLVFILKLQITLWLYILNLTDNFNVLFGITASFGRYTACTPSMVKLVDVVLWIQVRVDAVVNVLTNQIIVSLTADAISLWAIVSLKLTLHSSIYSGSAHHLITLNFLFNGW